MPRSHRLFSFDASADHLASASRARAIEESGLSVAHGDARLDRLTRLAVRSTSAPAALVTVVEPTRQVFASAHGLPARLAGRTETPLAQSFCQYVVTNEVPLVVDDARQHPVLATHPAVVENGVVAYAGHPVRHPDGTVIGTLCLAASEPREWSEADVTTLADLAGILETDVAQRVKRAVAERLQQRLMGAMDSAASTAIIQADVDGVITFVSHGAARLLGLDPEQVMALEHLEDLTRSWHPVSGRGTPDGAEDWLLTDAAGEQRVVTVRRTTLRDESGAAYGSTLVCDDVSARHRAEKLLLESVRKQEAVVEQMKTLDRARTEFIATASHELRTPVTSILGYAEMLAEGAAGPLDPHQARLLERVTRNGERLLRLIEDLLTLSQAEADEQAPVWSTVDVGEVARQAWDTMGPHFVGRTLDVRLEVPSTPALVRGDSVEIGRVVVNLLTNAVKYTPDGGSVTLLVRRAGEAVEVAVADTGIGIDGADQGRVFEPFFRAHEVQQRAIQGSGLGLALVRQLTRAHGGSVRLDSEPGRGTTVTVSLPGRS
ncbi:MULTISPECIES: ATP-binding protein [unclassified Nocardioides]|uniref:ATP-binding protein n=1 Tax=unclassified Nocardioides TaxID=2615069 RepID=UPI002665A697|nr:ATP-binding protein [Nocardioides sp. Arc9.136]WKN50304.1 ATP-binding protein [Nocardioides sp. Arc9.136]